MNEPKRNPGEPSMVFRGRLMYWHLNPEGPPYEELNVEWTIAGGGLCWPAAWSASATPRTGDHPGFTPHVGGPGQVAVARIGG